MNQHFSFENYLVRPVEDRDRAYIDRLTANDPFHVGRMDADWFLKLAPGEASWAIEDKLGRVVLYFKTQNAVRLSLQFGEQDREENRETLTKGLAWLEGLLIQNGFAELIFDTDSPALKATAKKRLGFVEAGAGTLIRSLGTPQPIKRSTGHWHHAPTASEEARE